uniref:C2H2-type domain-containing protein n=1 Tax=Timema bartmani TaxID=61472 RepID=A0A7R9I2E4_9NEOP|nr:unnamed protein product [Timema bartmani]
MSSNKQYFEGESTSPHIIIVNRSEKRNNDSIFTKVNPNSSLISKVFIDDLNSMDIISDSRQINSSSFSEIHIENLSSFSVLTGNTPKYNSLSNVWPDVSYLSNSQPENVIFDQLGSHHSLDKTEPCLQVNVDNFVTFPEQSNFDRAADVTHIEIIKPKKSASRRLTGANRVLPFITNMWQGGEQQVTEPTLAATYKAFFESLEYMDERKCEECQLELLSSTHLQYHLKEVHKRKTVMLEQGKKHIDRMKAASGSKKNIDLGLAAKNAVSSVDYMVKVYILVLMIMK